MPFFNENRTESLWVLVAEHLPEQSGQMLSLGVRSVARQAERRREVAEEVELNDRQTSPRVADDAMVSWVANIRGVDSQFIVGTGCWLFDDMPDGVVEEHWPMENTG